FRCEACILGKAHRAPIHDNVVPKSTVPGHTTHWDTCGPITPSLANSTYMEVGVDEATRMVFVDFHKSKDTVNQTIINTITKIKTQKGPATAKRLHCDSGGELCGGEFEKWVNQQGIQHTTSAPHTPEHNGLAERTIQSVVSAARCMLISSGLPMKFWAEAACMAAIILNMAPTKAHPKSSPLQEWTGTTPNVSSIRTFGCRVLVKDPSPTGKFTARTWDGIYLGPSQRGDGHRIWDPNTARMNNSRDVYFLEGKGRPEFTSETPIPDFASEASASEESSEDEDEDKRPAITIQLAGKRSKAAPRTRVAPSTTSKQGAPAKSALAPARAPPPSSPVANNQPPSPQSTPPSPQVYYLPFEDDQEEEDEPLIPHPRGAPTNPSESSDSEAEDTPTVSTVPSPQSPH